MSEVRGLTLRTPFLLLLLTARSEWPVTNLASL